MYHEVGIAKLSSAQLSRLRNGHKVRVKMGEAHKIKVSQEQLKKLNSAHKKGKAYTILFDPYQIEKHGAGIYGDIATKSKCCGKGVVSDTLQLASNVTEKVGLGVARKHITAPKKRYIRKGKGFLGDLGNIAKTGALSIAQQGMDAGTTYLNNKINGTGALPHRRIVGRRNINKKKTHGGSGSGIGGALYPSGYAP
jgi:hypothetical protein